MLDNAATAQLLCPGDAGLDTALLPAPGLRPGLGRDRTEERCFHCGLPAPASRWTRGEKSFCCTGCLHVFDLLTENGLEGYYDFGQVAGVRVEERVNAQFSFADSPSVRERLADFADARLTRVTFHIPAIHCIACVWLLENLFRLAAGIGPSQVNFLRKEVAISFRTGEIKLSEVIGLLASLGYEPELKLSALDTRRPSFGSRRLWMQLGIAGFAFGNTMLFSIASYLGLDSWSGPGFRRLFGVISLILAVPVVVYSAQDYWRAAWRSLRQRLLNIDVPIAAGILALFAQSTWEVLSGGGNGYFDSLAGLLFFLLCGKLFQQKTYDRLSFDRDYRAFFPLSVRRCHAGSEASVSLSELNIGDTLLIRNGELIPADSRLIEGPGYIDYSFVTGESEPVEKGPDDYLYAGGRQMGGAIRVETLKPVSQSYLTSLWNQEAFQKDDPNDSLGALTNRYSQRFTKLVIGIAIGAAAFWAVAQPELSLKAFTSVLIVACPCALALAAPFALGTAQRVLATRHIFLKNPGVIERLALADAIVFDKTGTLTAGQTAIRFNGAALGKSEEQWLRALTEHSIHPLSVRLRDALGGNSSPNTVDAFSEVAGCGMEGKIDGHHICLGSGRWIQSKLSRSALNVRDQEQTASGHAGAAVHVAVDGRYRGWFQLCSAIRPEAGRLISELAPDYELMLLSGDNDRDRERFHSVFGPRAGLHFEQSPLDKLSFIKRLQDSGKSVIMVGDGLNDAGALKQSDVGVAVVENISAFCPASDVILAANRVAQLSRIVRFAKTSVRVVRASFLVSTLYNVIGITIAARGMLAPVVCAILMPLSSVTVVAFACGLTRWLAARMLPGPTDLQRRRLKPAATSPACSEVTARNPHAEEAGT